MGTVEREYCTTCDPNNDFGDCCCADIAQVEVEDDGECHCYAQSVSECACGNFHWMEVPRPERIWWTTLGTNLELAASLAAYGRAMYVKGYTDSTTLREFCEDTPAAYFPMADSRPRAERLGWKYYEDTCAHMNGEWGSCARCEGT